MAKPKKTKSNLKKSFSKNSKFIWHVKGELI